MKTTPEDALICVDVQNDFCFGGALPVPCGERVAAPLNRAMLKFETIVLTRDWHPADHCSFSDDPEYKDGSWPAHCMQDSPGAEFHGEFHAPLDAILINKGTSPDREAYSGFQDTGLRETLRKRGIKRVFIGGLATDYCVKATAIDALYFGFEVWLLQDACRGVSEATTAAAIDAMRDAGVQFTSTGELE
jgi:nicotinamidase/pyrazinamidase